MARYKSVFSRPRRMGIAALTFGLLLAASAARAGTDVPAARFTDPARREKLARAFPAIEAKMAERQKEMGIPGLAYGVIIDGELALAGSAGVRDQAIKAPVDADTVFRIASMSKSFTGLAVLKLRDEGKLGLDDPVSRWVPELAGKRFHVRMHRRGLKGALLSPVEERLLDEALLAALQKAGAEGALRFDDADAVIDLETVDRRAGLALWTRADVERHPFLKPG